MSRTSAFAFSPMACTATCRPAGVGAPNLTAERVFRRHQQPGGRRIVLIGLEEERGRRAERTVDEPLHPGESHPVITRSIDAQALGDAERQSARGEKRDPQGEAPALASAETPAYRPRRPPRTVRSCSPRPTAGHAPRCSEGDARGASAASTCSTDGRAAASSTGPIASSLRIPVELTGGRSRTIVAADNLPGGAGDTGRTQGQAVGEAHVTVQPAHEDGIVGCDRVDPLPARKWSAGPALVIPVSARDPLAGASLGGEGGDPPDEFLRRVGIPQVHAGELKAPVSRWTWPSMNPGVTSALPFCITGVRSPISLAILALSPTATMVSPRVATAPTRGRVESPVQTFPKTTRSAGRVPALQATAKSSSVAEAQRGSRLIGRPVAANWSEWKGDRGCRAAPPASAGHAGTRRPVPSCGVAGCRCSHTDTAHGRWSRD